MIVSARGSLLSGSELHENFRVGRRSGRTSPSVSKRGSRRLFVNGVWCVRRNAAGVAVAVGVLVAAVALVGACGSSSASSGGTTSSSPSPTSAASPASPTTASSATPSTGDSASSTATSMTVVTRSEAGAALGQTVKAPVRGHATVEGGVAAVFYGPQAPAGANADVPVTDSVRVVLVTGPSALKYFNDYRSKVHAQPVAGLGDKAYYDGYASLSVLKGDEYLRVAVIGVPHVLSAEEKLAAAAVPRM
jgi:hypothetical protein